MSNLHAHNYYINLLNKLVEIAPVVESYKHFADFVESAYNEDGEPESNSAIYLPMLSCFLFQIQDVVSKNEFAEIMKVYDFNKLMESNLFEVVGCLVISNGILIDLRNEE